jgi:hypothetical protein
MSSSRYAINKLIEELMVDMTPEEFDQTMMELPDEMIVWIWDNIPLSGYAKFMEFSLLHRDAKLRLNPFDDET